MFQVLDIQGTPNPDSKKFFLDSELLAIGVRQFESKKEGEADAVAKPLFQLDGVMSVFYMKNFVTVTKYPEIRWKDIESSVVTTLTALAIEGGLSASATGAVAVKTKEEEALLTKINQVIDQNIRPALAGDGGGLEILALEGTTLKIRYQGACGSCPSATMGTLMAIQNLLQRMVNPQIRVVSGEF